MTEERLIARISVTPGGESDGRQLTELVGKAQENGIEEKNRELKEAHGLGRADSVGLFTVQL